MKLLLIDTSGNSGFAAWYATDTPLTVKRTTNPNSQLEEIPVFVSSFIESFGTPDLVSVIAGPGSYTGLRVGLSLAKGICLGCNAKLVMVDTLTVIKQAFLIKYPHFIQSPSWLIPMLDARRMEVFHAVYDSIGQVLRKPAPLVLSEEWLNSLPEGSALLGDGASKIGQWTLQKRIFCFSDLVPTAEALLQLSLEAIAQAKFTDLFHAVPLYTKAFFTTAKLLPEVDASGVLRASEGNTTNR